MLEIEFDPNVISYSDILQEFWKNHDAGKDRYYKGRQYISILLIHDETQLEVAHKMKKIWEEKLNTPIQTEFQTYNRFYVAEDYHQKYYLKRFKNAAEFLLNQFSNHKEFNDSTIAARLNGIAKGNGTIAALREEIENWELDNNAKVDIFNLLDQIKW
jgi:peptide-methionine (S)-S-oxide reductase